MMCQAYNANNEMEEMIGNDIDLFEDGGLKDPYFLCLRLLNLIRNKKKSRLKKGGHFKFLIEQDNEIIDQTPAMEDVYWVMKTQTISLNKSQLHFIVPDRTNSNTQFDMKMYRSSQNSVQEIANLQITIDTYIELFLEQGKNVFTETIALCPQYSLQYQIYIQKTKIQLDNLLASDQNDTVNGAFKKKAFEFIQIDHEKVEVLKKDSIQNNPYALRKSLHFNHKKSVKPKDQMTQKQIIKPQKGNLQIPSIFSKIVTIITQCLSKNQPLQHSQKINIKRKQQLQTSKQSYGSDCSTMKLKKNNFFAGKKIFLAKMIVTFVFTVIVIYLMLTQSKKMRPTKWFKTSFF